MELGKEFSALELCLQHGFDGAHLTLFRMTGLMLDRNAEFIPPNRQIAQPERNKFRVPENVRCARFDRSLPNLLCTSNGIGNNGQACGFRAAGASG
jgi:hypothetical protein